MKLLSGSCGMETKELDQWHFGDEPKNLTSKRPKK